MCVCMVDVCGSSNKDARTSFVGRSQNLFHFAILVVHIVNECREYGQDTEYSTRLGLSEGVIRRNGLEGIRFLFAVLAPNFHRLQVLLLIIYRAGGTICRDGGTVFGWRFEWPPVHIQGGHRNAFMPVDGGRVVAANNKSGAELGDRSYVLASLGSVRSLCSLLYRLTRLL